MNPEEARRHQEQLEGLVNKFDRQVREGKEQETGKCYDSFISKVKTILCNVLPSMEEGDASVVLATIKDTAGTVFHGDVASPRSSTSMEERDIPMVDEVKGLSQVTKQQQQLISEILWDLGHTHDAAASACYKLSMLADHAPAHVFHPVLHASIRPLVQ